MTTACAAAFPAFAQNGPVRPMYGNIRPFYGDIRAFYGNIRPFYGNIRPFWGNIRPFWGDTAAFYGDLKSFWAVDNPVVAPGAPDYRRVGDFWAATGAAYDPIFTAWSGLNPTTAKASDYQPIADQLKGMLSTSRDFWGQAVQAQTGKSFDQAFAAPLLAKYGIDLSNPASLGKLDQTDQAVFFLEYYDTLMNYSGTDHVDWWMKSVNWTPSLTKTQGSGQGTTVGLLDQTVGDAALQQNVVKYSGVSNYTDGHGAAVASLIVGAHDGQGVMGLAPRASVIAFNPFDATGTASWADVTRGVQMLKASGASVVNMSLGVPGSTLDQGWNNVFSDPKVELILKNTVFVMAAGNEGYTQNRNIQWSPLNPAFIVVGSVGVDGTISNFSNRPGTSCLTTLGLLCLPGQELKNNFIVAPGEMILVSDGHGGVTRMSGTSFAAPLVSGAIALLHDRWPWLVNFPRETVNIILSSAKDLGAPGTDPVYGRGELDVTASQSPLNFNSLIWFTVENGQMKPQTARTVLATYQSEQQKTWDAQGAYFYAFEPLGLLTQRDFAIPLSQKLVGQNVTTYMGAQEQFQAYLLARMSAWAASQGGSRLASTPSGSFFASTTAVGGAWGSDMSVSFAPRAPRYGFVDQGPAYQSALRLQGEKAAVTVGFGDGAPALVSQPGFTQPGDYDSERGGANPLLGLASGGAYAGWTYKLAGRWQVSASALQRDERRDPRILPALGVVGNGAASYSAGAQQLTLTYQPSSSLTLSAGYTHLREGSGLLGVQSFDPEDFRHGSTTDGLTAGFAWAPSARLSVAATGTLGRTRTSNPGQSLAVDGAGLTTSAFELGVTTQGLLARSDRLRLTVAQPLHVEGGHLDVTTVQVVDRSTGEIGIVSQRVGVSEPRRLAAELLYAVPADSGRADLSLFGRAEGQADGRQPVRYIAGARYHLAF